MTCHILGILGIFEETLTVAVNRREWAIKIKKIAACNRVAVQFAKAAHAKEEVIS